jgi:hypothetical protein
MVFIGTNTKQRSRKDDGHKDKKNSKPCPHEPGAKDPFVLPVTKHCRGRKIVTVNLGQ